MHLKLFSDASIAIISANNLTFIRSFYLFREQNQQLPRDGYVIEGDGLEAGVMERHYGAELVFDAGGGQVLNGEVIGIAFGADASGNGPLQMIHSDIVDIYTAHSAGRRAPAAGLENQAVKHIVTPAGTVGIYAGAMENAVVHLQVFGWLHKTDAIAGCVDVAIVDAESIPVASGDAVVARLETAVVNLDVLASPDMDTVPSLSDIESFKYRIFKLIAKECIVGRTSDMDIFDPDVLALCDDDSVRTSHGFFSSGIEKMPSVYGAFAGYRNIA